MKLKLIYILLIFICSAQAHGLVVVVNEDCQIDSLTKRQVIDIYMGRFNTFPDGQKATPIDYPPQSAIKSQFYMRLVQQNERKVSTYWARLLFSGNATPPTTIASVKDIINNVRANKDMIAYIPESEVTEGVKVVFKVAEN